MLSANATGLPSATSASFDVVVGLAAKLQVTAGTGQSASINTALTTPITVQVTDIVGNGVAGVPVRFAVVTGGGSLSVASGVSDASGNVSTGWTLGAFVGIESISATATSLAGSPLTITATATGGASGSMTVFGGNNQFAVANATVLTPPSVIVRDGSINHNPVVDVAVTFTASAGSSITGPATVFTGGNGIAAVGGWTLGATGSFTLTASASGYANVVFTGTVNTVPMSVTLGGKAAERHAAVLGHRRECGDTYTWTVNGIAGGNSTFGTITNTGFYTAPATVPTPSTFAVCAQSVQTPANKGCINVTITVTPSAGGELIVINDVNWGDNSYGLGFYGDTYTNPGNVQFVRNLVGFTPTGVRSSASNVLMLDDVGSGYTFNSQWSNMSSLINSLGYSTTLTALHSDLYNIASDVKLVILQVPRGSFGVSEINGLKTFASQGGRILFIGENGGYYSYGLALEDAFLASMGALMTNTGACDAPGVIVNSVPHQLTTGIAASGAGGFYMNCVSHMNLGPNDFALMNYGGVVVAAIAKIDYTPITLSSRMQPVPGGITPLRVPGAGPSILSVPKPMGIPGWTTTGPPPRP